ncbi:protein suppressor of variegation 3-7 [Drosophila obscura]|uniref:protein suppressor of variegation 3-7 n=1 Tax=Drosophila obscura TaxID=7282 RepID=UPI001BB28578|nr:protein suppressor of variegation 3-7 [Drosophila obscura]
MDEQSALGEKIDQTTDTGNKMASADANSKTTQHELKIMDVEGAMDTTDVPLVIEVEDSDIEETADNAHVVGGQQTALISSAAEDEKPLDDPLVEDKENMSTKTELSSDVESNNSYVDPMGLLERLDNHGDADSQDDEDDFSMDDGAPAGTSARTLSSANRWQVWMNRWPWLLHEDSDGTYAFCLYCNIKLNVNRKSKHIQQHNMSLYHQERETNYLAFKESEKLAQAATGEQNNAEVKHEFGTSSYVAAMKEKRGREIDSFNDFNWTRWLAVHPWLERSQPQGTLGTCTWCNVKMNVEFVYLRKRHEASKSHVEFVRQQGVFLKQSLKRKRTASTHQPPVPQEEEEEEEPAPRQNSTIVTVVGGDIDASNDPSQWCELVGDTSPQQCRCTLCNCQMAITSFLRHCKTKVHCQSLYLHQNSDSSMLNRGIWAHYSELHPWMVADPDDASMAYCSICCKRFVYGHSEIKRKSHENSEKHLAAVAANKAANGGVAEAVEEEEQQPSEPAPSVARTESEGSDGEYQLDEDDEDWSESHKGYSAEQTSPWKRRTRPAPRFYSWLRYSKDRKTQICRFCRVRFYNESSKARHELSVRHNKLVKQHKLRQGMLRQENQLQEEQSNTDSGTIDEKSAMPSSKIGNTIPATMKGKVMVWKERYPWLSYKRSEQRRNYGWCKLCEVSVFLPTSKYASKHQRSSRHVRLRIERKRTGDKPPAAANKDVISAAVATAAALTSADAKQKAAMAELQAKYDWLDPDATDENHCNCRICETRLPIKVFFLRQHDSSRKHADNLEKYKSNAAATKPSLAAGAAAEMHDHGLEVDQDSDEALSVKSEGSTTGEPPSKRSRRSMEVRRILRVLRDSVGKRSDERSQMDMAKDMICSSFDIVTRLRNLERDAGPQMDSTALAPGSPNVSITSVPPGPRHVMDLFFDSISPTMKALPADLAAEGKAKIMQLVCGLEVRAMQRVVGANAPASGSTGANGVAHSTETASSDASPNNGADSSSPALSNSTTISINDLMDEHNAQQNNNEVEKASQSSPMTQNKGQVTVSVNGSAKDLLSNVRRYWPTSMQVSSRQDADAVRCVPLNKLTTPSSLNVRKSVNSSSETTCTFTPVKSASPPKTDANNGNPLAMMRQIRVNNGNQSKMITISKTQTVPQHKQPPAQQVRHPAASTNGGAHIQKAQTQAQYRAVQSSNNNRIVKSQQLTISRPSNTHKP